MVKSFVILATENSVLIATDVAARGLDIKGIENVIHYQIPRSAEVCYSFGVIVITVYFL